MLHNFFMKILKNKFCFIIFVSKQFVALTKQCFTGSEFEINDCILPYYLTNGLHKKKKIKDPADTPDSFIYF